MIVVDVNVLAYWRLGGPLAEAAATALERDAAWAVPPLWRAEFRNVLALYIRKQGLGPGDAIEAFAAVEQLVGRHERSPSAAGVLQRASASKCSAYDCEYVALAEEAGLRLITNDPAILKAFPRVATRLADFAAGN